MINKPTSMGHAVYLVRAYKMLEMNIVISFELVTKISKKHPLFFDWMSDIVVSKSLSFQHYLSNKVIYSMTSAI